VNDHPLNLDWLVGTSVVAHPSGERTLGGLSLVDVTAPLPGYHSAFEFRVYFRTRREGGWPDAEESRRLKDVDDALDASLNAWAVPVQRLLLPYFRLYTYYTSDAEHANRWIVEHRSDDELPIAEISDVVSDPGWTAVLKWRPLALEASGDLKTIMALEKFGADRDELREIRHLFYFREEAQARELATHVSDELSDRFSAEFLVDHARNLYPEVSHTDQGEWQVKVSMISLYHPAVVVWFTTTFRSLARRFHGTYDGWEAAVGPSEDALHRQGTEGPS
jgi:hypothetical protein